MGDINIKVSDENISTEKDIKDKLIVTLNKIIHEATKINPNLLTTHKKVPSLSNLDINLANIPSFTMENVMDAASKMNDIALAHEIAINEDFLLQKSVPKLDKDIMNLNCQDFWTDLQVELDETPPISTSAMVLFGAIKKSLMLLLLQHHNNLRTQMNEEFDLNLMRQQIEKGVLDFQHYANFIISMMSKLCAPVRDSNIRHLKSLTEMIPVYKGIVETLELMNMDMANFTIQQTRPLIKQYCVEYEQQKLREFLQKLEDVSSSDSYFVVTKKWLTDIYVTSEMSKSEILTKAYLKILQWEKDTDFPETLLVDKERLLKLKQQFTELIFASSILLITYSTIGDPIYGLSDLRIHLKNLLFVLLKDTSSYIYENELKGYLKLIAMQIIKEVNESLIKHGFQEMKESKANSMTQQIENLISLKQPVREVLTKRILEFIESVLISSNFSTPIPNTLSMVQEELYLVTSLFCRLIAHNKAVYNDYYDKLIMKIMESNVKKVDSNAEAADSNAKTSDLNAKNVESNTERAELNAENVESNTENVESNAKSVESNAERAESIAESAESISESAESIAESVESNVESAESFAESVESNVESAGSNAESEESNSESEKSNTESAGSNAESAKSNAKNAESNAESAKSNAKNAESNAESAKSNAKNAESNTKIIDSVESKSKNYE